MSNERARAALEMFEAALALPPDERTSWVEEECSDDGELVAEVKSLLAAHEEAGDFLDCNRTDLGRTGLGRTGLEGGGVTKTSTKRVAWQAIIPGQQLGDFLIERQIGAGGMGLVYRARQVSLNRPVALKVLPNHLHCSESARTRFQREIEAAARLHHRNIVAVYTTGEERGIVYYAMELIDGPALSQVVEELTRRPLAEVRACLPIARRAGKSVGSTRPMAGDVTPTPDGTGPAAIDLTAFAADGGYFSALAKLMADVASGLEYSHQMQVIHRDVKPSNLLLSQDGRIHIGDFGLARLAEEPGLTRTGDVLGTPFYMAPEQISAAVGEIDERTDVYALGATLYELLTLRPPFVGENREQVISKILHCEPKSPRAINRLVPRDLDTICLKALEKQPGRRYRSAGAIAEDLRLFAEGRPISARRSGAIERGIKWVERHRAWSAALAAMCALVVVATFFAYRTYRAEARWTDAEFERVFEAAQLAALEGDLNRAADAITQAEELGAPPPQLSLMRGLVALQAGQHQDACDALELAAKEMPDSLAAHALLVEAYEANQQREKRRLIASRLESMKPSTLQDYLLLGQAQMNQNLSQAELTLDEAVKQYKTSVAARIMRGCALIYRATDSGDAKHAELALDDLRIAGELLEPNPLLLDWTIEAHLLAATAYGDAGDLKRREQHLDEAAVAADVLQRFSDQSRPHSWRAFYYEYVGLDQQAIEAWREKKDKTITFLVVSLYRLGRFDEALELCDERLARYKGARFTQFLRGFIFAATQDTPQEMLAAFEPDGKETLDTINAHRFTYAIYCLAGDVDRAQQFSRELRTSGITLATDEEPWKRILDYSCGDLDEDALMREVKEWRSVLCQAHFVIGVTNLAQGDRQVARQHFRASSDLRLPLNVEYYMSRALIAQLDRQPDWPPWIAAGQVNVATGGSK